jgi:hypothetical protein
MSLGNVRSVRVEINDKVRTGVSTDGGPIDIYMAAYNAEFNEFGDTATIDVDQFVTPIGLDDIGVIDRMRETAAYGEFVFCLISSEAFLALSRSFFDNLETSFGVTKWRDNESMIGAGEEFGSTEFDYWFFARRGDFSFVPREEVKVRNGSDIEVQLETRLVEQSGEDGQLFTPVSYAGKIKGQMAPKAHRLFRRRVTDKLAPVSAPRTEVAQEEYNQISQPDLRNMQSRSGQVFREQFRSLEGHTTELPDSWALASSSPQMAGASSMEGARMMDGRLILGPAPMDAADVPGLAGEPEESMWAGGNEVSDICAYRAFSDQSGFLVRGRFEAPDTEKHEAPLFVSAYKSESLPSATDGFGFTVSLGESDNIHIVDDSPGSSEQSGPDWPLQTASYRIEAGTEYSFIMMYDTPPEGESTAVGVSLWVWPTAGIRPSDPIIKMGAKTPLNVRNGTIGEKNRVGVGIDRRGDGYWMISEMAVESIDESYAQAVMELDVSGQRGELDFAITARAQGANTTTGGVEYGHSIYVWDFQRQEWQFIERPSYTAFEVYTHSFSVKLLPEVVDQGRIFLLASSENPHIHSLDDVTESILEVDYVYGRSVAVERKGYGKTDFYFRQTADTSRNDRGLTSYRPSQVVEVELENAQDLNIIPIDPGKKEAFPAPVEEILSAVVLDDSDNEIATLDPKIEYRYFWTNSSVRGSMREELAVVVDPRFVGSRIRFTVRVHSMVRSVHSFFESSDRRKIDGDILSRHKQSVFVDVFAKHEGSATGLEEDVREWIFDLTGNELNVSDLVRFLASRGAEDILLYDGSNEEDALNVVARRIDADGNEQSETSYSLIKKNRTETFVPGTVRILSL